MYSYVSPALPVSRDPDGNRMELQVDACSAEEGRAMMAATDNRAGGAVRSLACPERSRAAGDRQVNGLVARRGGEVRRRRRCWRSRRATRRRSRWRMG